MLTRSVDVFLRVTYLCFEDVAKVTVGQYLRFETMWDACMMGFTADGLNRVY
jgi:hypothetical protein